MNIKHLRHFFLMLRDFNQIFETQFLLGILVLRSPESENLEVFYRKVCVNLTESESFN